MATVLTKPENEVYVTLLTKGANLSFGEYLELNEVAPLFKGYDLDPILRKLDASNLIISKGDKENKFDMVRAVSYENNKIIIKSGS